MLLLLACECVWVCVCVCLPNQNWYYYIHAPTATPLLVVISVVVKLWVAPRFFFLSLLLPLGQPVTKCRLATLVGTGGGEGEETILLPTRQMQY